LIVSHQNISSFLVIYNDHNDQIIPAVSSGKSVPPVYWRQPGRSPGIVLK